jgi:hypothetical protein
MVPGISARSLDMGMWFGLELEEDRGTATCVKECSYLIVNAHETAIDLPRQVPFEAPNDLFLG